MKSIIVRTTLPAPAHIVWAAVLRPETYLHVVGRMLRYPAAERHSGPWRVGDKTVGWMLLFRLIPFARHTIVIESIDHDTMTLVGDERNALVPTWRHYITVDPEGADRCRYEDRIDTEAGMLTPLVAAFAHVFYRYRQRRWRRLARKLASSATAEEVTVRV